MAVLSGHQELRLPTGWPASGPMSRIPRASAAEAAALAPITVPSYAFRRPRPAKGEIQWHQNRLLMERGVGQVRNGLRGRRDQGRHGGGTDSRWRRLSSGVDQLPHDSQRCLEHGRGSCEAKEVGRGAIAFRLGTDPTRVLLRAESSAAWLGARRPSSSGSCCLSLWSLSRTNLTGGKNENDC